MYNLELNGDVMKLKRGTIFNITSEGTYDGKKWFRLTEEDKRLVFPDIAKAATYIEEHYGHWACSHYLKSRYEC